jgi:hypothetical protein
VAWAYQQQSRLDRSRRALSRTHLERHLGLLREVNDVDVKSTEVVALVGGEELEHPLAQRLNLLKIGVERDVERETLRGWAGPADVFDELGVEDVVRQEDVFAVDAAEDGAHEEHLLDNIRVAVDVDPVSNVEGVLGKDEDGRAENLLGSCADEPRETEQERAGRRHERGELGRL